MIRQPAEPYYEAYLALQALSNSIRAGAKDDHNHILHHMAGNIGLYAYDILHECDEQRDAADLIEKEMGELQKENSALREGMKTLQEESSHLKTRLSDSWKENDRLSKLLYGEYKPHAHISKGSEEEQLKDTVPEENDEWKCSLCGNPTTHYDTTTCENYCEQCGTSADIDFPVPNEALKDLIEDKQDPLFDELVEHLTT